MSAVVEVKSSINQTDQPSATASPSTGCCNWNKARMFTLQTLLAVSTIGIPIAAYYTHLTSSNKSFWVLDGSDWNNLIPCRILATSNVLTGCSTVALASMLGLGAKKTIQTLTAPITLLVGSFRKCCCR